MISFEHFFKIPFIISSNLPVRKTHAIKLIHLVIIIIPINVVLILDDRKEMERQ